MSNNVLGTAYVNAFPNMNNLALKVRIQFEAIDFTPIKRGIEEAVANGMSQGMNSQSSAKDWIGLGANAITIGQFVSPAKFESAAVLFTNIDSLATEATGSIGNLANSFRDTIPSIRKNADALEIWARGVYLKHIGSRKIEGAAMWHIFKHGNLAAKLKMVGKALKFVAPIALLAGAAFLLLNEDAREALLGVIGNITEAVPKIAAKTVLAI